MGSEELNWNIEQRRWINKKPQDMKQYLLITT
jgi:hypothetical protein